MEYVFTTVSGGIADSSSTKVQEVFIDWDDLNDTDADADDCSNRWIIFTF